MGVKNTQFNTRGPFLGEYVSGKYDGYHTNQLGEVSAAPLEASGGVISDWVDPGSGKVYRNHIFTSSGTLVVSAISGTLPNAADYLVIGGGGGGGGSYEAGGGGAGGYRTTLPEGPGGGGSAEATYPLAVGNYTITVGGGGQGGGGDYDTPTAVGGVGSQSALFPAPQSYPDPSYIRSEGGGSGGTYSSGPPESMALGVSGGSGGGCGNIHPAGPGAGGAADMIAGTSTPVTTQGYKGGDRGPQAHAPLYNAAGGGGAGAAGADQTTNTAPGSYGGNGKRTEITGPTYSIGTPGPSSTGGTGGGDSTAVAGGWLAGGGGGGLYGYSPNSNLPETRGAGGGGAGGNGSPAFRATDGIGGTGGGGGGSGSNNAVEGQGGVGGSGIVVVRYQIGTTAPGAKATGGSISRYDDKFIHTFTSSGTFATGPTWTSATVEYVVVAGGGGGNSNDVGGGGGAGGYVTGTTPIGAHPVSTTIQIGAGGITSYATNIQGYSGTDSFFGPPITALGGGGGAAGPGGNVGANGGSGGGGGYQTPRAGGTTPDPTQGNPGGGGISPGASGGGGGGAGGAGTTATPNQGGDGGIGVQLPTTFRDPDSTVGTPGPSGIYWVAGGGGGSNDSGNAGGRGGGPGGPYAGGGNGGHYPGYDGSAGLTNTGGGGGATDDGDDSVPAHIDGSGGSGIVLVAYPA